MTAHDINKKLQALNILFCRRKLQKVCLLEREGYWRRGLCFQLQSIQGVIGEGDNWGGGGGLREPLLYVIYE